MRHLKAGETVHQAGELPKTPRGSKIQYEPLKTVCERPFASMENGDGTRYREFVAYSSAAVWPQYVFVYKRVWQGNEAEQAVDLHVP